jgi:hypothetical protein
MLDMERGRRPLAIATLANLHCLRLTSAHGLRIRGRLRTALALGALALTLSVGAPAAYAATFTVTNLNDSGPGSLRQAIIDANTTPGPDTVTFTVTGTITLTSGQLTVTDDLTIDGPGAASLTVSGNNASRVMQVSGGAAVTLRGVTVANGSADGGSGIATGGFFEELTVEDTMLVRNVAQGSGGAIFDNNSTVTVRRSTFVENSANGGGAISTQSGSVTVSESTFTRNTAADNGGGLFIQGGSLDLSTSTLSENSARHGGGMSVGGVVTVTNSTFTANRALGSFFGGGAIGNGGELAITNSTFSENFSPDNGAALSTGTPIALRNTIVANSVTGSNCFGPIVDGGGNLQHPGMDCGATIPSADPLLGPLAANDGPAPDPPDGPTKTHALQPGSPAIDTALLAWCPPTDQRGVTRPQGNGCDIGAFELEVALCPPGDDDLDDDGLDDDSEDRFGSLLNDADSDDDGIRDGNDDGDDDGEDDEDEDDDEDDDCPDEDSDGDGEDDEDEDDDEDDD